MSLATFRDLIAENQRKSVWLVVSFCIVTSLALTGLVLGIVSLMVPELLEVWFWPATVMTFIGGLIIAGLVALLGVRRGDRIVLVISRARLVHKVDDPQLYNVVEEVAIAACIPPPQIYLIEDYAMNAFATGRDPEHAAVAITRGLRERLTREELQGVIAHEIAHIRNYDIRLMMLLAVLIGMVAVLADFLLQSLRFTSSKKGLNRCGGKASGGLIAAVVIVVAVLLALVAPLVAQVIQLAVSREREYLADATAVELTRNPHGILGALRKISQDDAVLQVANRGTAHLYFVNPIRNYAARGATIFSSHPPIEERIRRLEALLV
jgi:heat shock protein HtpX